MSVVRIIGAVSREYHTSVLDVLKMPWCLFMALVRDLCDRIRAENKMRNKAEMKSRSKAHMAKSVTPL